MDSKRAALESGDGPDAKRLGTTDDLGNASSGGDGSQVVLGKHVAPFTGNGCTPSLESYLFESTPAGSQLLPWKSSADEPCLDNDAELEKTTSDNKKPDTAKLSRRELAKMRREHTLRALALERELTNKPGQSPASEVLLIRFPDPEITATMLAGLSKEIRDVVLPISVAPRYCLVHLRAGADVEATICDINKVRFGTGYLRAELKPFSDEEQAEFIDPCSLYVGNMPFNMTTSAIKAYFANAMRVDIGVLKREKRARYAFVRYATPDQTMDAFRELVDSPLNSRTLTVRYRRLRKRAGMPTVQCATSFQALQSPNGDDDNADCKVISPPPVESIIVSDSDNNCSDSSGNGKNASVGKRKSKISEQEGEIQKLKRQMAEYGAIIKSLQFRQNTLEDTFITDLTPKVEPCANPSGGLPRSNEVHLMRDIKKECDYLGISDPVPASKPTTQSPDDSQKRAKNSCFGRLFTGPFRRSTSGGDECEKDGRLEELYAQLERDPDP
ncbi:protein painting of fourth [Drosophila erecta]|uniref:RRM domain-containing protein n=1 Tax=Drosophila erecta TaxID=7220 RepID=B3NQX3_DROER|nr:protein painting of fourth [Drosophila erecta]XP_026836828.1 protein painting of fourth [Drosophila erecta]XP_026836829.1 protein painting of fourth [Drosophila erecta]EDV57056.1 uncharacterized protein Dere_GG22999 [Drosophila erecta]